VSSTDTAEVQATDSGELTAFQRFKLAFDDLVGPGQAAIICGILPYLLMLPILRAASWQELITVDAFGESVCRYNDVTAFMLGMLGVAMAGLALWQSGTSRNRKLNYVVATIGLLLGLMHIARGLGWILGPCN